MPVRAIRPETAVLAALLLALFGVLELHTIAPHDFWWHVRTGQQIAASGAVPVVDQFSFTRSGEPWLNQAWLAELALWALLASGGPALVLFAHALCVSLGYGVLILALARSSGARAAALAGAAALALGWVNWGVRPQSASFLLFGALILLIEEQRRGARHALWGALPLFALWGNLHGAFVFGALALGCRAAGALLERALPERAGGEGDLLSVLLPSGLALLALGLNPLGPLGLVRYLASFTAGSATLELVQEFQPLTVRHADGWLFAGTWVALFALLTRPRPPLAADRILALVLFSAAALLARRALPWLGFAAAPALAELLAAALPDRSLGWAGRGARPALLLGAAALLAALALPWLRPQLPGASGPRALLSADTPVAALAFLCDSAPADARVYAALPFASYQIWACPRLPVFQDTRFELYPDAQWRDYLQLAQGRFDWDAIARRHALSHLFLSLAEQPELVAAAADSGRWVERYRDAVAVIFERAP